MLARRQILQSMGALSLASTVRAAEVWAAEPPPLLYDSHIHLFSSDFKRYPLNVSGAAPEIAVGLRDEIAAHPNTPELILKLWRENGVSGGSAVQDYSVYKDDNRYLLDSVDAHPQKFSATVILDATDPASPAKLRDLVHKHPVTGLRLTGRQDSQGQYPWLDSDPAQFLWAEADRLGFTIVVMFPPAKPTAERFSHMSVLAKRYSRVNLVLDSFGWPAFKGQPYTGVDSAYDVFANLPNCYFLLTDFVVEAIIASNVPTEDFMRQAVDKLGANRLMWGSGYGPNAPSYPETVSRLRKACTKLNPAERRAVMHDTGKSLFAFKADHHSVGGANHRAAG